MRLRKSGRRSLKEWPVASTRIWRARATMARNWLTVAGRWKSGAAKAMLPAQFVRGRPEESRFTLDTLRGLPVVSSHHCGSPGCQHNLRQFTDLAFRGASSTMALGVNGRYEVVGVYTVGSGNAAVMHGFTWTPQHGFRTVDDPQGIGTTTINGVNDFGQLVGFYVDNNGNTDGFLATPRD